MKILFNMFKIPKNKSFFNWWKRIKNGTMTLIPITSWIMMNTQEFCLAR